MSFKKVSVMIPTRGRIGYLEQLLESFDKTVVDKDKAELVFRADQDDLETIEFLCGTPYKFLVGSRENGYRSLPSFYNDMVKIAKGDVLICCNDDAVFVTPNWPQKLLDIANKYPDGIFDLGMHVGVNENFFPFSVVSRRLVDILGLINDERLLFSDLFLLDIARYFDRAIHIPEVVITHCWSGNVPDQTRIDANKHEFDMVFKDDTGAWSDEYRDKHNKVVTEAVMKICRYSDLTPDIAINTMMAYEPASDCDPQDIWPPSVQCRNWYYDEAPNAIHYPKIGIRRLIKLMYELGLDGGEILLSCYHNGLPNILWENVFDKVVAIDHQAEIAESIRDDKQVIASGPIGNRRFLFSVAEEFSDLRVIMLDDTKYNNIISVYYTFKKLIGSHGIVVFTNSGNRDPAHVGMHKFISDLASGRLDGMRHEIVMLDADDIASPGLAYEIIGTPPEDIPTKAEIQDRVLQVVTRKSAQAVLVEE